MSIRKITAIIVLALLISSSAIVLAAPQSSAGPEEVRTAEVVNTQSLYVSKEPQKAPYNGAFSSYTRVLESKYEASKEKALAYANGDTKQLTIDSDTVYKDSYYYLYSTSDFNLQYEHIDYVRVEPTKSTTVVFVNPGTYTIKVTEVTPKTDYLRIATRPDNYEEISIGTPKKYVFETTTSFYFCTSISTTVKYTMTPDSSPIDHHEATEKHVIATDMSWRVSDATLPMGDYTSLGSMSYVMVIIKAGTEEASSFEKEIVNASKYYRYEGSYSSPENIYKCLVASYSEHMVFDKATDVKIYMLLPNDNSNPSNIMVEKDSSYVSILTKFSTIKPQADASYNFYASAYSTFYVATDYNSAALTVNLIFNSDNGGTTKVQLKPGILYHVDNGQAKPYRIEITANHDNMGNIYGLNNGDSILGEFMLYTDALPSTDSSSPIFAVVAILLAAIAFGVLIFSGKKPAWSKDKEE